MHLHVLHMHVCYILANERLIKDIQYYYLLTHVPGSISKQREQIESEVHVSNCAYFQFLGNIINVI